MLFTSFYDECELQHLFQMLPFEMRDEMYEKLMFSGEWNGNPLNELFGLWTTNIFFATDIHRFLSDYREFNIMDWKGFLLSKREDIQYYLDMGSNPDLEYKLAVINHFNTIAFYDEDYADDYIITDLDEFVHFTYDDTDDFTLSE